MKSVITAFINSLRMSYQEWTVEKEIPKCPTTTTATTNNTSLIKLNSRRVIYDVETLSEYKVTIV